MMDLGDLSPIPVPAPRRLSAVQKPIEDLSSENNLDDVSPRFRKKKKSALSRLTQHMKDTDTHSPSDENKPDDDNKLTSSNIFDIDDLLPDDTSANNVKKEVEDKNDSFLNRAKNSITDTKSTVENGYRAIEDKLPVLSDGDSDVETPRTRKKKSSLSKLLAKKKLGSQESIQDGIDSEKASLQTESPILEDEETGEGKQSMVNHLNDSLLSSVKKSSPHLGSLQPLEPTANQKITKSASPRSHLSESIHNTLEDAPKKLTKVVAESNVTESLKNEKTENILEKLEPVSERLKDQDLSNKLIRKSPRELVKDPFVASTKNSLLDENLPELARTPHPPSTPKLEKRVPRILHRNRDIQSDYESGSNNGSSSSLIGDNIKSYLNKNNSGNGKNDNGENKEEKNEADKNGAEKNETNKNEADRNEADQSEPNSPESENSLSLTQQELTKNYQNILSDSQISGEESDIENDSVLGNKTKLTPVKAISALPAMDKDISSASLRTSYKSDWAHVYNKLKGAGMGGSTPLRAVKSDDMSTLASFHSQTLLRSIPTAQARKRNYLVGSIDATSSLMGTDELQRYFPDRTLRLMVGTFNLAEQKDTPKNLNDFLLPENMEFMPDMYVIGVQEMYVDRRDWEVKVQETLGPSHVLFHSAIHGSLHIAIYVKRDLIWFCSVPEECNVTTRAFKMIKTKGAVGICFTFFGTSFLFLGSHFRHGSSTAQSKERIEDYKLTIQGVDLPKQVIQNPHASVPEDATERFDCVFWCGDMNFRIQRDRQQVLDMIKAERQKEHPHYEELLKSDELNTMKNEGLIFNQFQEGRINFPPSYKFDIGTDKYDTSLKMRIPSYTDRVLFRCKKKNNIVCTQYNCAMTVNNSDHKPVYGLYEVTLKPGRDTIPLAAGQFNRDVYTEANKRRALHRVVSTMSANKSLTKTGSKICVIQ